ncbi:oxidoreductase [Alkalilimnicola ehrlichii]|uniref:Oxidoreductase n=1 Tax=Alkalilimnicola ehrlichii TaxID=351052 RepID=A0A3E0WT14_9GAMM|nr:ferredoxin--NADP reductase [Alkalilimnicola ehrlichii]RFA29211.1 oxidoreductase [Alkalilimnicola ehrlichii]RFA36122.1 oxidoreductase [Alkalilimnicola ehrlichii]
MKKLQNLKVVAIEPETDDAVTIHFKQPLLRKISYSAGQYLSFEVDTGDGRVCRAYSLSSTPGIDKHLSITVKRVQGGKVSTQFVHALSAGDSVKTFGAQGSFVHTPSPRQPRHLVLFAGGSGISPLFSILKSALHFEPGSYVSLVYCNRTPESVIFRDKLTKLQTQFPGRLAIRHIFSQPQPDQPANRLTHQGATELFSSLQRQSEQPVEYYLCGPSGLMEQALEALTELQVPEPSVHCERFVTARQKTGSGNTDVPNTPKKVSLQMNGQEFSFQVLPEQTILEAALANGVEPPFSCRSGFCTACVCKKLAGEVAMEEGHGLSKSELQMGQALMCVGRPLTDEVRLQIE